MAKKKIIHVQPYRRKSNGRTDYRLRLTLLTGYKPRLVIRRSLNHVSLQIVKYEPDGDRVIVSAHSKELGKYGWKTPAGNVVAAYLTGLLLGKRAKGKCPEGCVLDIGLSPSTKGSRTYAALKGAVDAGLTVPCAKEILPSDKRAMGADIESYAKQVKAKEPEKYRRQFSQYLSKSVDPTNMKAYIDDIKNKILKI